MAGSLRIGTLSVDLNANTATFEMNLDKAAASGKKALEQVNKVDLSEARGALTVLGEEIGVRLPRHVQRFMASLPGVAPALAAAFPVLAIVAIGKAILDATEKFHKHREEIEKQTAAASNSLRQHADSLQRDNLRLRRQQRWRARRPLLPQSNHSARMPQAWTGVLEKNRDVLVKHMARITRMKYY